MGFQNDSSKQNSLSFMSEQRSALICAYHSHIVDTYTSVYPRYRNGRDVNAPLDTGVMPYNCILKPSLGSLAKY